MSVVDMVDTIHANVSNLPAKTSKVAGYTTGTPDIRWTGADWARFSGSKVRIDQSNSTHPLSGDVKDIENGASTIATAVEWARERHALGIRSTFYLSGWQLREAERQVRNAGLSEFVFYWIANWNLSREEAAHFLGGRIVAVQYASPSSNPHTKLPGTNLTLSQANADLSVSVDWWMEVPQRKRRIPRPKLPHPHPKVTGGASAGAITTAVIAALNGLHLHISAVEAGAIATTVAALVAYYVPSGKR